MRVRRSVEEELLKRLGSAEERLGEMRGLVKLAEGSTKKKGTEELYKVREQDFLALAGEVIGHGRTLLPQARLFTLWQAVKNVAPLGLPAAEVGSYRGGSAYFLAGAFRAIRGEEVRLDVVDTFEGHPAERLSEHDHPRHVPGLFGDTSYDEVREYLSPFEKVRVHKGEFSKMMTRLDEPAYSLAHVDVDLYEPTADCLRFFAPRLPPGGVIVLDDYDAPKCPGVREAVTKFLDTRAPFHAWNPRTQQVVLVKIG